MEKIIQEKIERQQAEEEYHDAFDYMLSTSKEHGQQLNIQELKVPERSTHYDTDFILAIQGGQLNFHSESGNEIRLHFIQIRPHKTS